MTKTPPSTAGIGAVFPEQYEEQLAAKISQVKDLFAAHKLPEEIEVHRSSTEHFRMRTEFRMWHEVRLSPICQQLQDTQPLLPARRQLREA
jgi:tRNA/tmRNA/rRNA uracil-C5-methylase (TrmA/RlmC/RlmD family)